MKALILLVTFSLIACNPFEAIKRTAKVGEPQNKVFEKVQGERKFRTYKLDNNLEVLLVSDPNVTVSSAALDVSVGSLASPEGKDGLPHFLEHMLFLTTKKYPEVGGYDAHLDKYQGSHNAYTAAGNTNYFFEVNHDGYREALDRFAQFFISPNFDGEYFDKEKEAVNNEHLGNYQDDGRREWRIFGLLTPEGHSMRGFGTGNIETLKNVTKEDVVAFYEKEYSSDRMKLALISNESLDTLQTWVKESFSDVPLRKTKPFTPEDYVFAKEDLPMSVAIQPISQVRKLTFTFESPNPEKYWQSKAPNVLGSIIGHEGKGSLLSKLKQENLALGLSAGASETAAVGTFNISVTVTEKGERQYKRVGELVFSYIKMLKQSKDQMEVHHKDEQFMAALQLEYATPPQGTDVSGLASLMQQHPPLELMERSQLYGEFSKKDVQDFLKGMTPENLVFTQISPDVETDQVEKYYDAHYKKGKLSDELLAAFKAANDTSGFHVPEANPFLPKRADLKLVSKDNKLAAPKMLGQTYATRLFFSSDLQFDRPKTFSKLYLSVPNTLEDMRSYALGVLYLGIVRESLNEEITYPMLMAGYSLNLGTNLGAIGGAGLTGPKGLITIELAGFSSNTKTLLTQVVKRLKNIELSEERFQALKQTALEQMENQKYGDAYLLALEESSALTFASFVRQSDYIEELSKLTLSDLKSFAENKLFAEAGAQLLVYGNENPEDWSLDVLDEILAELGAKPVTTTWEGRGVLKWTPGKSFAFKRQGEVNSNSAFWSRIQFGARTPENDALSNLAQTLLGTYYYKRMRTDRQLGYAVWGFGGNYGKASGFDMVVQSGEHGPDEIAAANRAWLGEAIEVLKSYTPEEIEVFRSNLLSKMNEPKTDMAGVYERLMDQVDRQSGDFTYRNKVISAVKTYPAEKIVADLVDGFELKRGGQMSIYFNAAGRAEAKIGEQEEEVLDQEKFREESEKF